MKKVSKIVIGIVCVLFFSLNAGMIKEYLQLQSVQQDCVLREAQADTNEVISFQIIADRTGYVGSYISTDDVTLKNVCYADGTVQDTVSSGFCFMDGRGKETDVYQITEMDNQITVIYEGCADSFSVTGIIPQKLEIEVGYTGESVYAGDEIDVKRILLKVKPNIEGMSEYEVAGSEKSITLEDYTIVEGSNVVKGSYRYYNTDQEFAFQMPITGKKNPPTKMTAKYKGAWVAGTKLTPQDFQIELVLESGRKVSSNNDATIFEHIVLSGNTELTAGTNVVKLAYAGSEVETECKINLAGVPNVVEPGQTATPTEEVTMLPTPVLSPTHSPEPTPALLPTHSPEPTSVLLPTHSLEPSSIPEETHTVEVTSSPAAIPEQKPKVGKKYTVSGLRYKVVSYGKTSASNKVALIGYDKAVSKVSLKATVSIQNVKFRVVRIENKAFKNCKKVKGDLVIPKYVTKVGDYAFMGCSNIKSVDLPKGVTSIGKRSFYDCKNLSDFWFKGNTIKHIGADALKKQKKHRAIGCPKGRERYYAKKLKGKC